MGLPADAAQMARARARASAVLLAVAAALASACSGDSAHVADESAGGDDAGSAAAQQGPPGVAPDGGDAAKSPEQLACEDLAADADPSVNRARIQSCLDAPWGHARLRGGATYAIDAALSVDSGDVLEGESADARARIEPAEASAPFATVSNAIINVVNGEGGPVGGTLRNITIDLRDARPPSGNTLYGVRVAYDDNLVEHIEITSTPMPFRLTRAVSLYFGTGHRNVARHLHIHHAAFGVVFVGGNTEAMSPWVDQATIADNRGDSVTFAGYGKLTKSVIHGNGFDDGNSNSGTRLPPGGALYASSVNQAGGWIEGNTVYDQCGANVELNMTRNFRVIGNTIYHPGWPGMNGKSSLIRQGEPSYAVPAGFCKSAMSVLMIATSDSVFRNNIILNSNRPANTSANTSNGGSEEWFGPGKADLPSPDGTAIALAFVLGREHRDSKGGVHYAVRNQFVGNYMAAIVEGKAGLGWLAGRGTGFGPGGTWDAQTTANVFDDNSHCDPNGPCAPAPYTKRCGDNRYGTGVATCKGAGGENLHDGVAVGNRCNRDDLTHEGAGHDARRNDGCLEY